MNWPTIRLLAISGDLLTRTFFAFYIWENTHSLPLILFVSALYFGVIPITELISGVITDQFDTKIPMLMGIWMQIIQVILIINLDFPFTEGGLIFIALAGGIGEGFKNIATHAIEFNLQDRTNITNYYANRTFYSKLAELLLPISAAYLVTLTNDYQLLFKLIIVLLFIKTIFIIFIKLPIHRNPFDLNKILTFPGTNRDKATLVKGVFLEGISDGIVLSVLPVIVLVFAESLLKWGYINSLVILIGVFTSYIFSRTLTDVNSKTLYALGAFIFAGASVFFLADYSLFIIILFLLANELMKVIKDVVYSASVERIMDEDKKEYHLYSEYQFLVDSINSIGRLIPIGALMVLNINMGDELSLRLTLILIGLLPLITLTVLGKSKIFQPHHVEDRIESIRKELIPELGKETTEKPTDSDEY